MKFFKLIADIFNVSVIADRIKNDEQKRAKSFRFAVSSIIYSVIMAVFAALGTYLLISLEAAGLLAVFAVVIGVVFLVGALITMIGATVRLSAQFSINRTAMSWVALAVFLLCLGLSVATVFIFMNL